MEIHLKQKKAFTLKLQSPKAMNNMRDGQVFWLTPLCPAFPPLCIGAVTNRMDIGYLEFTAAGQLRIYTGFPFNPQCNKLHREPKALQM